MSKNKKYYKRNVLTPCNDVCETCSAGTRFDCKVCKPWFEHTSKQEQIGQLPQDIQQWAMMKQDTTDRDFHEKQCLCPLG